MKRLFLAINQFYKFAISKEKFDNIKSINSKEQFAILSIKNIEGYKTEELSSAWVDEDKTIKEDSLIIYDIDFDKVLKLALKNKQDAFIYKPKEGPVQLINLKEKYIKISDKYNWSSSGDLWSKSKEDKTSFEFGFFYKGYIELPYKGKPYFWKHKEVMDYFKITK